MTARPAAGASADEPPQPPRHGLLDRVFRTSLILVPVGVLANVWWSWYATDHSVFASIGSLPRKYLYLALVLALIPWFTNALRLLIWIRFIGGRMRFRDTFRITLGGELASSVVPTASGTEVFRWGMMVQAGITKGQAASIVTLGYLEDFLFFATAVPTAIVISGAWHLPLIRLASFFRLPRLAQTRRSVLVLNSDRGSSGLVVDRIHGQREVVVRAIRDPLIQAPGISGATELGDGRPVLILDGGAFTSGAVRPNAASSPLISN